jgi:hypothetical protein
MLGGGLACGKEQAASEPQTQGPFPRPDRVLWRGLRSRDSTATPQSPRGGCSWYSVVARPGDASDAAVVAGRHPADHPASAAHAMRTGATRAVK